MVIGPMFAGKTSEIQSVVRRFECLGQRVLVVTADIDVRYAAATTPATLAALPEQLRACGSPAPAALAALPEQLRACGSSAPAALAALPEPETLAEALPLSAAITHDRVQIPAVAVPVDGLLALLETPAFHAATAIVVDEAQFFTGGCLVPFVLRAVEEFGKHAVVVGLDGDAARQPFGDILTLIPLADTVEKKTALCRICCNGTPALFSRSKKVASSQVLVGGAECYEPVCRRHFLHPE